MLKKDRYNSFIEYFSKNQPEATTELNYDNPYQLIVAVILSAQCTDKRVNIVTPALFKAFPTFNDLAASTFDDLFPLIKSISYPNNKSRHLIGMAQMLKNDFKGQIPTDINQLQKLPGVGRKTANVVSSVLFNQPNMPVDTHVFRVSKRLGLVNKNSKTPLQVEKQLVKNIPDKYISRAHHWLILLGRYTCLARNPKCEQCPVTGICNYYKKNKA